MIHGRLRVFATWPPADRMLQRRSVSVAGSRGVPGSPGPATCRGGSRNGRAAKSRPTRLPYLRRPRLGGAERRDARGSARKVGSAPRFMLGRLLCERIHQTASSTSSFRYQSVRLRRLAMAPSYAGTVTGRCHCLPDGTRAGMETARAAGVPRLRQQHARTFNVRSRPRTREARTQLRREISARRCRSVPRCRDAQNS